MKLIQNFSFDPIIHPSGELPLEFLVQNYNEIGLFLIDFNFTEVEKLTKFITAIRE